MIYEPGCTSISKRSEPSCLTDLLAASTSALNSSTLGITSIENKVSWVMGVLWQPTPHPLTLGDTENARHGQQSYHRFLSHTERKGGSTQTPSAEISVRNLTFVSIDVIPWRLPPPPASRRLPPPPASSRPPRILSNSTVTKILHIMYIKGNICWKL